MLVWLTQESVWAFLFTTVCVDHVQKFLLEKGILSEKSLCVQRELEKIYLTKSVELTLVVALRFTLLNGAESQQL